MELVIAFDNGDCEVVSEDIGNYDFKYVADRAAIISAIERTVNKVKAFQVAYPPKSKPTWRI